MSGIELSVETSQKPTSEVSASSSSVKEAIITKSDQVWFADGNLILQTSTKRYRVHRGVLAAHSSVFKDTLCLPQPIEQPEAFEECPVIRLTGDLTEDWDELLPLIYHLRDLRNEDCLIDVHLMVAMLRLGKKYDFNHFKSLALKQLRRAFPNNFDECKRMIEGGTFDGASYNNFAVGYEFCLLDVALNLGVQTALPLAFFTCLKRCTISEIFDGSYEIDLVTGRSGTLSSVTQKTLLRATSMIIQDISDDVYSWWKQAKPASKCTTCGEAIRTQAIQMIGVPTIDEIFTPKFGKQTIKGLCGPCKKHVNSSVEAGQRQVFEKLPKYFGLPEWAALKDSSF